MRIITFCILLFCSVSWADKENVDVEVKEDGPATVQSPNYPEDAPANLDKTWKLTAPEGKVIKLDCSDIRLFEEDPCGPWVLIIQDGGKKEEICTSIFDYSKTSSGNKLEVTLKIGPEDRGFLDCKATAVAKA